MRSASSFVRIYRCSLGLAVAAWVGVLLASGAQAEPASVKAVTVQPEGSAQTAVAQPDAQAVIAQPVAATPPDVTRSATVEIPQSSAAPQPPPPQVQAAAVAPAAPAPAGTRFAREELEPLLQRLEAEGYSRETLNRIFYDRRLHRLDRVVTYNVLNPDSAKIYEQFVTPFAIRLAKGFRRHHARELRDLERRYSVSPEVIVGILLVETQFGASALQYRLLEVFTTLIVDATPDAVERHYQRIKAEYPALDRAWVEERLAKKAGWAYDELKALLSIRHRLRVASLYEVKGSYAGAFGMPQFMPSSYMQWAVDGNNDRRVDLDNPADAMASIANFLVQHGWRADATLDQKMRAVWEYNRSTHYVRTIFAVALRMTRPARKQGSAPAEPAEAAVPASKPIETVPAASAAPVQAEMQPRQPESVDSAALDVGSTAPAIRQSEPEAATPSQDGAPTL